MARVTLRRQEIEYSEEILAINKDGHSTRYLGKRRMRCTVEATAEMDDIMLAMGARACRSKSGKCRDGPVTVKRVGSPVEVSREMKESPV